MKHRRLLALLLVLVMSMSILLTGCKPKVPTPDPTPDPDPTPSPSEPVEDLTFKLEYAEGTVLRMATGYNNAKTGLFFDAETAKNGITLADGKTYNAGATSAARRHSPSM